MVVYMPHPNLAISQVAIAPSPSISGTSLTVTTGDGLAVFTPGTYELTAWPPGVNPMKANAEIVLGTLPSSSDTFTIVRAQGDTTAKAIAVGWQIAADATAKVFTDIETSITEIGASIPDIEAAIGAVALGSAKIQWVSNLGNDSNSGLSQYEAKLTILAAYDALPAEGGTVYITSDATNGLVGIGGPGIWLMGSADSAYASPPAGWRHIKQVGFIGIRSVGGGIGSQGRVIIQATTADGPHIWLSDVNPGITFENLQIQYPKVGIRIGVDSTNGDRNTPFVSGWIFRNVGVLLDQSLGNGPSVDMGHSFWGLFDGCSISGNLAEAVDSDLRAAVFCDAGLSGVSSGFRMVNTNLSNGGIRYYAGSGSQWNLAIDNVTLEGDFVHSVPPLFDLVRANDYGRAVIRDSVIADAPGSLVIARIPPRTSPDVVHVSGCAGEVVGPARVDTPYASSATISPANAGQYGMGGGRLNGRHDGARRLGGMVAVRFPNLAPQDVSTWAAKTGTATVTTGQTDLDGGTNAALLTSASGTLSKDIYRPAKTYTVGERLIAGVWMHGSATTGPVGGVVAVTGSGNTLDTLGITYLALLPGLVVGDGEWQWASGRAVVTATSGTPAELVMALQTTPGNPTTYYAPMLLSIPAGAISDNEAAEMEMNLASYADGAVAGDAALRRGQKLYVGGRPAVAANATDLATALTLVNDLKTKLIAAGLVS